MINIKCKDYKMSIIILQFYTKVNNLSYELPW